MRRVRSRRDDDVLVLRSVFVLAYRGRCDRLCSGQRRQQRVVDLHRDLQPSPRSTQVEEWRQELNSRAGPGKRLWPP